MKCYISVLCVLSAFVAVNLAAPTTLDESVLVPLHHQVVKRQADTQQELVDRIVAYSNNKIAYLRTLSPQLFEILDNVVQNVTSQVFRIVGGTLLRSGGLGGGGGGGGSSGGSRVSVVLPTFPPDEDEDEDEESSEEIDLRINPSSSSSRSPIALRTRADLKTANSDKNEIVNNEVSDDLITTSTSAPIPSTTLLDFSTTDIITTTVINSPELFTVS